MRVYPVLVAASLFAAPAHAAWWMEIIADGPKTMSNGWDCPNGKSCYQIEAISPDTLSGDFFKSEAECFAEGIRRARRELPQSVARGEVHVRCTDRQAPPLAFDGTPPEWIGSFGKPHQAGEAYGRHPGDGSVGR